MAWGFRAVGDQVPWGPNRKARSFTLDSRVHYSGASKGRMKVGGVIKVIPNKGPVLFGILNPTYLTPHLFEASDLHCIKP